MAGGQSGWQTFKAWVAQGAKDLHNHVVPAFPAFAHGVDEAATPQNNRSEGIAAVQPAAPASSVAAVSIEQNVQHQPSFNDRLAASVPEAPAPQPQAEQSVEM